VPGGKPFAKDVRDDGSARAGTSGRSNQRSPLLKTILLLGVRRLTLCFRATHRFAQTSPQGEGMVHKLARLPAYLKQQVNIQRRN
jgi:hypothetical protein